MIQEIITVFWLLLPAAFANMAPVIFNRIEFLNYPISKKMFGENKTWRGFFFGILTAIIIASVQKIVYLHTNYSAGINYNLINTVLLGSLLGFGALFGDLIKSFIKRKIGIKPGKSFILFDQIDWILGALVFSSFYFVLSPKAWFIAVLIFAPLHLAFNYIGYLLNLKRNKF